MGDVVNMHRQLGRVHKAGILADILTEAKCTADASLALSETDWENAAALASERLGRKVHPPSTATRMLVWHRLSERERLASTNPLMGLPS